MEEVIKLIESKLEDAKDNARRINSMNPSRMVDIQGYAWDSIAFRFEELLKEVRGMK